MTKKIAKNGQDSLPAVQDFNMEATKYESGSLVTWLQRQVVFFSGKNSLSNIVDSFLLNYAWKGKGCDEDGDHYDARQHLLLLSKKMMILTIMITKKAEEGNNEKHSDEIKQMRRRNWEGV